MHVNAAGSMFGKQLFCHQHRQTRPAKAGPKHQPMNPKQLVQERPHQQHTRLLLTHSQDLNYLGCKQKQALQKFQKITVTRGAAFLVPLPVGHKNSEEMPSPLLVRERKNVD